MISLDVVALGLTWYVVFLFSTTCHEAAHAWAAKLGGDLTAFHGGQVSLSPVPHIRRELVGMVIFPLLTFFTGGWMMGWASAPYDPDWSYRHPHRASWMALAGPASNLALAIFAGIAMHIGIAVGIFYVPESAQFSQIVEPATSGAIEAIATILSLLFSLNVLLAVFNLIPIPPLDGFGAIGLFMSEEQARRFAELGRSFGQVSYLGLLLGWRLFDALYTPLFALSLHALYPFVQFE